MKNIDEHDILDFKSGTAWERWLEGHFSTSDGVWLRIAKKDSGIQSVTITDALDGALCYGWIDSQRRGYDDKYYLQRYTPRRRKSLWSKINVDRAEILIEEGRMKPGGMREIENAKADGRWTAAYAPLRTFRVPAFVTRALARNARAQSSFLKLDKSARYVLLLPILKAPTPGRRGELLRKAIASLASRKKPKKAGI